MDTPPDRPVCAPAPYRISPLPPAEGPAPARRSPVATLFSALALALSFASFLIVSRAATTLSVLAAPRAMTTRRPPTSLYDAAEDVARRHGVPLYIAPDIRARAMELRASDCTDGLLRNALRTLDDYAATRNLRFHLVDGVLRLETRTAPPSFDCDDTLARCAERLDTLGLLHVAYEATVADRRVRIDIRHIGAALPEAYASLTGAGLDVDVDGRTLHVYAHGPTPEPADDTLGADAVLRLSSGDFVLSRASLVAAIESAPPVMRNTRILPELRGGRVVGVRLLRVGDDDLPARIGLRTHDVLLRINGYALASPDRCMEAYSRLRDMRVVTLDIERDGHPVRLRYRIV